MNSSTLIAVALGSNLGDRTAHLDHAVARLSRLLTTFRASPRYDTVPVEVAGDQPLYLNAAVTGQTVLAPRALLAALQGIEGERDRLRPYPNAPRTLDLDLILYGDAIITDDDLQVPHPRFRERVFVLEPLAAIAPELVDPVTGMTVAALLVRARQAPPAARR